MVRDAHESAAGVEASDAIAQTMKHLGLEPFRAPDPLPPIELEDVRLVCWMEIA